MKRVRRDLLRTAGRLGWSVDGDTGGGHVRLCHAASGATYWTGATPSDWRGQRNLIAALRREARRAAARSPAAATPKREGHGRRGGR